MVVRFELQLFSELGFGLDLAQCASTGARPNSSMCRPNRGGRSSRTAGEPWADKMLQLPAFLCDARVVPAGRDLADGFALTGFFLTRHVMEPRGLVLADERAYFIAALGRALPSVASIQSAALDESPGELYEVLFMAGRSSSYRI